MQETGDGNPVTQVEVLLRHSDCDKRVRIAKRLGGELDQFHNDPTHNQLDRQVAEEIARQLAQDTFEIVRKELSRSLRHSKFLPKDIAFSIAYDLESISVPFLEVTQVFTTSELCDIARMADQFAKAALARRQGLPPEVSETLSECGDLVAVDCLVENANAEIPDQAYHNLMERFDGETGLFDKITNRQSLPVAIAALLIPKVSSAAAEKLAENYPAFLDYLNPIQLEAKYAAIIAMIERTEAADLAFLANGMEARGELCPQLILFSLQKGCVGFFHASIAAMTGLSQAEVKEIISDPRSKEWEDLFQKARIPSVAVPLIETELAKLESDGLEPEASLTAAAL